MGFAAVDELGCHCGVVGALTRVRIFCRAVLFHSSCHSEDNGMPCTCLCIRAPASYRRCMSSCTNACSRQSATDLERHTPYNVRPPVPQAFTDNDTQPMHSEGRHCDTHCGDPTSPVGVDVPADFPTLMQSQ